MKIYLARPISGSNGVDVIGYYDEMRKMMTGWGYRVFSPMTGKGYFRTEEKFRSHGYEGLPISTNHAIFERDQWMVIQSDVVYVNLLKTKMVSVGCMMELAWASYLNKHTVVVFEEGNIHEHAFVLEAADILFRTEEEAENYLIKLVRKP